MRQDNTKAFADFPALAAHLESLGLFRMRPGLDRMQAALDRLNLRRPPCCVIQIVGTNGKGSTSTMLAALAQAHGLRAGLHTSPHFLSPRERVRLDGAMLPEDRWLELANVLMEHGGHDLSYFEFVTCLAIMAFAEADIAIMETGLGGSYDATTALEADLLVFTPIDLDHQFVLGPSLKHIAADKAGAIRPGVPSLTAAQRPEAMAELARVSAERGSALLDIPPALAPPDQTRHPLGLEGDHQRDNARLALAAWRHIRDNGPLSPETYQRLNAALRRTELADLEGRALASAWLPGRFQRVPPLNGHLPAQPETTKATGGCLPITGFAPRARKAAICAEEVTIPQEAEWDVAAGNARRASRRKWRVNSDGPRPEQKGPLDDAIGQKTYLETAPCALGWPPLLLDGAHNSHGLAALGRALARRNVAPAAVIFACLADKDTQTMLPHLRALATGPVFVPPIANNPRAMPPEDLAALVGLNAVPAASLRHAIELASAHMAERLPEAFTGQRPDNPLLVCGSLYLLAKLYALRPDCLERPQSKINSF